MAKQTINIGTAELAGDGETLRSAFNKVNNNFTELYNNDAADITLASFSVGAEGTPSGDGSIAYNNTTGVFTYTPPAGGGGGIGEIVQDTTPQLGGNLDMNGFEIVTTNGGHILLDPDTTGGVGIGNVTNPSTLLHLQQSAPIITLQRLNNALSQGISWTGQAGTEAAHIKLDGTGGTTNTLIMSTFDGSSVTERLRVMAASGAGIQVTGTLNGHTIPGGAGTLALTSNIPSDTDGLSEGTTNLYYTDARADARAQLKVDALVDAAPGTMDTLNELAAALGDDPNFATTTANNIATKLPLAGGTMSGAIDMGSNNITTTGKILFANMYATEGDLPNATTYHGMFAHVHATGAGYFAHGGNWIKLANDSQLSSYQTTAGLNSAIDSHLNQSSATTGQYLSWNGSDYAWVGIGTGGGGSSLTVQDEGSALSTAATTLNFVGSSVTASGTGATKTITIGSDNIINQGNSNVTVTDTGSDGNISFQTEGTGRWSFTSAGHLLPSSNAAYDIGSADYKVRHLFLSDNSLKFVDSSDVEYTLGVASGRLQYASKDLIISSSTANQLIDVSGSSLSISIGNASSSGSTVNIGAEVNNTNVNMNGVTEFNARAIFNRGVHEKFLTLTGATGVVAHNVQNGHVFYHTGAAANFTANFTNLSLAQEDATNIAIIINQGNTGYIPSAVQIGGAAQTIVWNGNSTPSATDNGTDVFSFTILNDGGTYVVLGQMVSFGGV